MQKALQLARLAEANGEVPVGAVLVLNNEIIGEGYNQLITTNDPTAHAEIMALRDAGRRMKNYRLPGSCLYVTLEPCSMCAGALVHARVQHLVFAAAEPRAGVIVSQARFLEQDFLNHRLSHEGGVLENESSQLLRDFFKLKRRP